MVKDEKHLPVEFRKLLHYIDITLRQAINPRYLPRWGKASMATAGAILVRAAETAERREKERPLEAVTGSWKYS